MDEIGRIMLKRHLYEAMSATPLTRLGEVPDVMVLMEAMTGRKPPFAISTTPGPTHKSDVAGDGPSCQMQSHELSGCQNGVETTDWKSKIVASMSYLCSVVSTVLQRIRSHLGSMTEVAGQERGLSRVNYSAARLQSWNQRHPHLHALPVVTREEALAARDETGKCVQWFYASQETRSFPKQPQTPHMAGKLPLLPISQSMPAEDVTIPFEIWLRQRHLTSRLELEGVEDRWISYRFLPAQWNLLDGGEGSFPTYHGTTWYALGMVLNYGGVLASISEYFGHAMVEGFAGVYSTKTREQAAEYAKPHIVFGNGVFHRVVLELAVAEAGILHYYDRGASPTWVHHEQAVLLKGIHIKINSPPGVGEGRFYEWNPWLEVLLTGEDPHLPIRKNVLNSYEVEEEKTNTSRELYPNKLTGVFACEVCGSWMTKCVGLD